MCIAVHADDVNRDRFRTMINVEGDCIGAAVVAHLCRNQLLKPNGDADHVIDKNRIKSSDSGLSESTIDCQTEL